MPVDGEAVFCDRQSHDDRRFVVGFTWIGDLTEPWAFLDSKAVAFVFAVFA